MNKHVRNILIGVGAIAACLVLAICVYFIYLAASYSRIDDNLPLAVSGNSETGVELNKEYVIATFNIGFGAYDSEFSYFTDKSKMKSGKTYKGDHGKAVSRVQVRNNVDGIAGVLEVNDYDFVLLQEVDEDGDRSYHIDQRAMIEDRLNGMGALSDPEFGYNGVYAKNVHTPYIYFPFGDPFGKNTSGLLTLSKYKIDSAARRKLPVSDGFLDRFYLDACFSVSRMAAGDKQLVIVNLQLSKGGDIRAKQIEAVYDFISAERDKGNYVIVGGSFNYDICGSDGSFPTDEVRPDWASELPDLPSGFLVAEANNKDKVPTCRSSARDYVMGRNYTGIVDGFIISDNVTIKQEEIKKTSTEINGETQAKGVYNLDMNFTFSDHNAVQMTFVLEEQ